MSAEEILQGAEKKMEKMLHILDEELKGIRAGRASPGLVDHVKVDYYGTGTPLKQLATIAICGGRTPALPRPSDARTENRTE